MQEAYKINKSFDHPCYHKTGINTCVLNNGFGGRPQSILELNMSCIPINRGPQLLTK